MRVFIFACAYSVIIIDYTKKGLRTKLNLSNALTCPNQLPMPKLNLPHAQIKLPLLRKNLPMRYHHIRDFAHAQMNSPMLRKNLPMLKLILPHAQMILPMLRKNLPMLK